VNQDKSSYVDNTTYIAIENAYNEEKLGPKVT
jgi:hypothetical protein